MIVKYVKNDDLLHELKIEVVAAVINKNTEAHERKLQHYVNFEVIQMLFTRSVT